MELRWNMQKNRPLRSQTHHRRRADASSSGAQCAARTSVGGPEDHLLKEDHLLMSEF
jgi:hypothetical protein